MHKTAITAAPVLPIIADRWSPRSFDHDYQVTKHEKLSMLEAARWAPSSNNGQPWRFSILEKGTDLHAKFSATLSGWNQAWAPKASLLIVVSIDNKTADGTLNQIAYYDAGLAVANLTLQAQELGLYTHQLAGFDHNAAHEVLELSDKLVTLVAIAVGRLGSADQLEGPLHEREILPRVRHELDDLVLHGNL